MHGSCHIIHVNNMQQQQQHHNKRPPQVKPHNRSYHRLLSIAHDVIHTVEPSLAKIRQHFSNNVWGCLDVTILANERCGNWYHRHGRGSIDGGIGMVHSCNGTSHDCTNDSNNNIHNNQNNHIHIHKTCHFKSTDGHTGSWRFSLKRLNLQVFHQATKTRNKQTNIVIILDASVNKTMPDSFTRTIPLWAAVLNQTAGCYQQQQQQQTPPSTCETHCHAHYRQLNTPTNLVSRDEHAQMAALLDERVAELVQSRALVDPHRLRKALHSKPLTPFWVVPNAKDIDNDNDTEESLLSQLPTALDLDHCHPIVCFNCSPSSVNHNNNNNKNNQTNINLNKKIKPRWVSSTIHNNHVSFWYTPGAGDDQESWARGLTPSLFWNHFHEFLLWQQQNSLQNTNTESIEDRCDAWIDNLVENQWQKEHDPTYLDPPQVFGRALAATVSSSFDTLGLTQLSIGSRRAGRPPECWTYFDAVLNVTTTEYPNMCYRPSENTASAPSGRYYYLQLPVQEGKRDRSELERWMAVGIVFCIYHAQAGRRVLLHCAQGKDRSVAMALAVVVLFCKRIFPLQWNDSFASFPVHDLIQTAMEDVDATNAEETSLYHSSGLPDKAITGLLGRKGRDRLGKFVQEHNKRHANEDDSANNYCTALASKETLRIALHLVRQDREVAEPSRSTMQKLNRFFMSSAYEKEAD